MLFNSEHFYCSTKLNLKDNSELVFHPSGCNKAFNRPDKLKSHIISHSGIKPHRCSVCGKHFSRLPHLREHERGHRRDFRFVCQKCNRGFQREKLFKVHRCRYPLPAKGGARYRLSTKNGTDPSTGEKSQDADGDNDVVIVREERRTKRKVGRPRKNKMITVTPDSIKANKLVIQPARRGRPRRGGSRYGTRATTAMRQDLDSSRESGSALKPEMQSSAVNESESDIPVEEDPENPEPPSQDETGDPETAGIPIMLTEGDPEYGSSSSHGVVVLQPMVYEQQGDPEEVTTDTTSATTYKLEPGTEALDPDAVSLTHAQVLYSDQDGRVYTSTNSNPVDAGNATGTFAFKFPSHSQGALYQTGTGATLQGATLIATGPNMATLVVDGAATEVITEDGIAAIVTDSSGRQYATGLEGEGGLYQYEVDAMDHKPNIEESASKLTDTDPTT